ncbi:MAG: hypothetical protein IJM69_05730 [Firmicutes bacterium]|nr:hypothetical protein [Bacillota bacterium]
MKKNGFTVRASVLIYVIAAFLAGTIASTFLNAKGEETGMGILATVFAMAIGIVVAAVSSGLAGIFRALLWSAKGYRGTPFVVLGLLFSKGGVKVAADVSMLFETFFPASLLNKLSKGEISEEETGRQVKAVERAVFIFSLILPLACTIFGIVVRNSNLTAGGLMSAATLFILARTRGAGFHGSLVKCDYIQAGYGIYYYLRALAAFQNDLGILPDRLAEVETETYEERVFDYIALVCWQAVYFVQCLGEEITLDDISRAFVKHERMYGFAYRELGATRERINLNHVYCCYMMITGNDDARENLIEEYYDRLTLGDSKSAVAVQKEIDWHRDLLAGVDVNMDAHPLFHPIDFIRWFPGYSGKYAEIKAKVTAAL